MTDLTALFDELDARPTPAAYLDAARRVDSAAPTARPLRVALLASCTIDPLVPYLTVESARRGLRVETYVAPFDNVQQELRNPEAGCLRFGPDAIVICPLLGDVSPELAGDFAGLSTEQVDTIQHRLVDEYVSGLLAFRSHSMAAIVATTFGQPRLTALGLADATAERSERETIRALNATLAREVRTIAGVSVLDYDAMRADVGHRNWHDDKMWHLARMPFTPAALLAFGRQVAVHLAALFGVRRKVLALDLDRTLWGGVLGEAGVAGIALGDTYPGSAFRSFQQYLLRLHRRGVLLAILSKNNEDEVAEVFRHHPGMLLKPEHFAASRINWAPKPGNLAAVAEELSVGTDSFVFFDDDAAECALMREMRPEVLTVRAPDDALRYVDAIESTGAFERVAITREDRHRGEMYRRRSLAIAEASRAGSVDAFLAGLEMVAVVRPADGHSFARVLDLVGRTNQFNLTTRRYAAEELRAAMDDPHRAVLTLQLSDRLGDHGLVGVAIAGVNGLVADIDTFLLSCRVIGRGVETALLAAVLDWAREHGATTLEGRFVATRKNAPAADFYPRHGFTPSADDGGGARWRLLLAEAAVQWPRHIQSGQPATA